MVNKQSSGALIQKTKTSINKHTRVLDGELDGAVSRRSTVQPAR